MTGDWEDDKNVLACKAHIGRLRTLDGPRLDELEGLPGLVRREDVEAVVRQLLVEEGADRFLLLHHQNRLLAMAPKVERPGPPEQMSFSTLRSAS